MIVVRCPDAVGGSQIIGSLSDSMEANTWPFTLIRNSLAYVGDSLVRTTQLHKILDPDAGPLIAIRMNILTRKNPRRPPNRPLRKSPRRGR